VLRHRGSKEGVAFNSKGVAFNEQRKPDFRKHQK
jgi:hypothetical protein